MKVRGLVDARVIYGSVAKARMRVSSDIDRDLRDSEVEAFGPDTRLGLAYNAALRAGTIALAACGYRAASDRKHDISFSASRFRPIRSGAPSAD